MCPGIRQLAVADPGFPRGGANFRGGCPILLFLNFVPKLHENEIIWTEGSHASLAPPWIHQRLVVFFWQFVSHLIYYIVFILFTDENNKLML